MRERLLITAIVVIATTSAFAIGVQYSRWKIRSYAEHIAARNDNTFSKCLLSDWEKTGELHKDWKGRRKWVLMEAEP